MRDSLRSHSLIVNSWKVHILIVRQQSTKYCLQLKGHTKIHLWVVSNNNWVTTESLLCEVALMLTLQVTSPFHLQNSHPQLQWNNYKISHFIPILFSIHLPFGVKYSLRHHYTRNHVQRSKHLEFNTLKKENYQAHTSIQIQVAFSYQKGIYCKVGFLNMSNLPLQHANKSKKGEQLQGRVLTGNSNFFFAFCKSVTASVYVTCTKSFSTTFWEHNNSNKHVKRIFLRTVSLHNLVFQTKAAHIVHLH